MFAFFDPANTSNDIHNVACAVAAKIDSLVAANREFWHQRCDEAFKNLYKVEKHGHALFKPRRHRCLLPIFQGDRYTQAQKIMCIALIHDGFGYDYPPLLSPPQEPDPDRPPAEEFAKLKQAVRYHARASGLVKIEKVKAVDLVTVEKWAQQLIGCANVHKGDMESTLPAAYDKDHPDESKQAPALTRGERITLKALSTFDPSHLASVVEIIETMPLAERISDRTARVAINKLIALNLAERPEGKKQGLRLTNSGRRLVRRWLITRQ